MGLTRFPRIYFKGDISWDPGLTNNNPEFYDARNVAVIVPPGQTLATLKRQLPMESVAAGGWNHFGTHSAVFENVRVTGTSLAPGRPDESDALHDKPLSLKGKLVDLFPLLDHGTHVFFDELRLGDAGAGLRAKRRKRLFMRFLNTRRNPSLTIAGVAGAVWEVCFHKAEIELDGAVSPVLQALANAFALDDVLGLTLRMHTYGTVYFQNGVKNQIEERPKTFAKLAALYADGKNFSNPAYSAVVGFIGIWGASEFEGHPGGRTLLPSADLGATFVELDEANARLTLDLGQTIPETNPQLEKADMGRLALVVEQGGERTELAALMPADYNREAYNRTAGVVDIQLPAATAATIIARFKRGRVSLELAGAGGPPVKQQETEFVVAVEERDIYLDQGEQRSTVLKVRRRGDRGTADMTVTVNEYDGDLQFVRQRPDLPVAANGEAVFNIPLATEPGFRAFSFSARPNAEPPQRPPPRMDRRIAFHLNVRTLPFDDALAASTDDRQLTWSWVYENILAVYDVLNPVMARPPMNAPLDNRQGVEARADDIKRRVDVTAFETFDYMPVTRDLSRGKRRLLQRWCDLVQSGAAPPEPIPANLRRVSPVRDFRVGQADKANPGGDK